MIGLPFILWLIFTTFDFGNIDQFFAILGVTGIILGIFALVKITPAQRKTIVITIALLGILVSISGCISNISFLSNLTPWNSVPPQ